MNESVTPLVSYCSESEIDILFLKNECDPSRGFLKYSNPTVVTLEDGTTVTSGADEDLFVTIEYEVILNGRGKSKRRPLKKPVRIFANPIITQQYRYFPNLDNIENIFPPSTNRFYSRLHAIDIEGYFDDGLTRSVQCYIHKCLDHKDRLWLTISDTESGYIYEAYLIHWYESNIFSMVVDARSSFTLTKRYADSVDKSNLFDVEGFLGGPPPTWNQLARILQDVWIPNLRIFDTLGETISQLVPSEFPEIARKSLCVFLGLLALDMIEKKDPEDVSIMFAPWSIIGALYNNHVLCSIQNIKPPSYTKLMHLAARSQMHGNSTVREHISKSKWLMFWHLLHDGMNNGPDEMPILLDIVERSNQLDMITGKIIPSRSMGQRSQKAWMKRLVSNSSTTSPSLICTPNLDALGLQQALYLGSAYCWPHKHLSYITRLGGSFNNSPHLQRMVLPTNASERVRSLIPALQNVTWSYMTFNSDLYTDRWNVRSEDILNSLGRPRPLKTLRKKYYAPSPSNVEHITSTEALVMDLITRTFHMMYLKQRSTLFKKLFGIKKHLFIRTALSLIKRGVLKPQYILIPRLPTLATIAYGTPKKIISLADAFLAGSPTCTTYICNDGSNAVFLSRMPQSDLGELGCALPIVGQRRDVSIRCFRTRTLRSYNHSLFQRLLREDGTWDDDVSGFLSQARSKRVQIANATRSMNREDHMR
ncbi:MAG: hypothetical protein E4H14_00415 [Candidatus Thorarchaeota archaeon]|nr:MAG: hypothetical protein E4H14_00415 [Candidatus Thorarchaeota archaeon]